jgi:hypothetical protein
MTKRTVHRLTMLESAKLMTYIEQNYTTNAMTDSQFAEKASEHLGFLIISHHVEVRRKALDIPATTPVRTPSLETMFEIVRELELRVAALEKKGA